MINLPVSHPNFNLFRNMKNYKYRSQVTRFLSANFHLFLKNQFHPISVFLVSHDLQKFVVKFFMLLDNRNDSVQMFLTLPTKMGNRKVAHYFYYEQNGFIFLYDF